MAPTLGLLRERSAKQMSSMDDTAFSYLDPWEQLQREDVALYYSNNVAHSTQFRAASCEVTKDHIELHCIASPGVGLQMLFIVIIGEQRSERSIQSLSYRPPIMTAFTGQGSNNAVTNGYNVKRNGCI